MESPLVRDVDIEQLVLGDVLIHPEAARDYVKLGVVPEDFAVHANRLTWGAIDGLLAQGLAPDFMMVLCQLRDDGHGQDVDSLYLSGITDGTPRQSVENRAHYCERLDALRRARSAVAANRRFESSLVEDPTCIDRGLIATHVERLRELGERSVPGVRGSSHVLFIDEAVAAFVARQDKNMATRLRLGFPMLDAGMSGLEPGEFLLVLGRTGSLKTMFLNHLLNQWHAEVVLLAELEMPTPQLVRRQLRIEHGLTDHQLDGALLRGKLNMAAFKERFARVAFLDQGQATLERVEAAGLDVKARHGALDAVLVDHAGLVRAGHSSSSYERASQTAIGLKQLARRLDTVVVAVVQANRTAANGTGPVALESARDSGCYEENADFVLAFSGLNEGDELPFIKLRLQKNRRGPQIPVSVSFDPRTLRMAEVEEGG